ncbi:MAG TPA: AlkA N-terminal domain-containing protein [Vulgatibacter sp.]|nr:AlkA N-terminal domain-containing protein [Vulgatibacter sp.]
MSSVRVEVTGPFHLEATVRTLQRRPTDRLDHLVDGAYLRLHRTREGLVLARVENRGSLDEPDLRLSFVHGRPSAALRRELAATTRRLLGLDVDPSPIEERLRRTAGLRDLATALRGMRPPCFATLLEGFGRTVPYQQLSLDAGSSLTARMMERFGESVEHEGRRYFAFPAAARLAAAAEDDFRALGFSRSKGRTLIGVAEALASGELDPDELESLPTPEAWQRLLALRGVGPWTASLLLLRGMGRLDAFPASDVGVNRGIATLLGEDPKTFHADRFAAPFGPQRGMIYFYSLGAQLLGKGLITPAGDPALRRGAEGPDRHSSL